MKNLRQKKINSLYGFIVGDCLGVPYEFTKSNNISKLEMVGYMTHNQPSGTWSDDTAFTLATLDSDLSAKQITKNFLDVLNGKYFPDGIMFDIGATTYQALQGNFSDNLNSGNGALMRMLPIAFLWNDYFWDHSEVGDCVQEVSFITHRSDESLICCVLYCCIVSNLLHDIFEIEDKVEQFIEILENNNATLDIFKQTSKCTKNGYVVDSLNIVLNIFKKATSFEDGMIQAINLGGDTDTHCAILGSLLGIKYGVPKKFIKQIRNKELVEKIIEERI